MKSVHAGNETFHVILFTEKLNMLFDAKITRELFGGPVRGRARPPPYKNGIHLLAHAVERDNAVENSFYRPEIWNMKNSLLAFLAFGIRFIKRAVHKIMDHLYMPLYRKKLLGPLPHEFADRRYSVATFNREFCDRQIAAESVPTSVMSVPSSVVMNGNRLWAVICCAKKAEME